MVRGCAEGVCHFACHAHIIHMFPRACHGLCNPFSDDGNTDSSDSCVTCMVRTAVGRVRGYLRLCESAPAHVLCFMSRQTAVCGDGTVWNTDGGSEGELHCVPRARSEPPPLTSHASLSFPECDDGNVTPGDGCDENCVVETCGNGVVQSGEDCDDSGTAAGDGCDENCKVRVQCAVRVVRTYADVACLPTGRIAGRNMRKRAGSNRRGMRRREHRQ